MKYKKLTVLCFAILSVFVTCLTVRAEAKDKIKQIGNFKYTYMDYSSKEIWIIQIDPVSGKGIETLNIPSSIDGKRVVKLGWKYDSDEYGSADNIFGVYRSEDNEKIGPKSVLDKVAKIKKISLPSTIKELTPNCFTYVQDGKSINIPSGVTKNIVNLNEQRTKWKKFTVSSQNKKYKVKKGMLLSKNGKKVYAYVGWKNKEVIPEGVKTICKKAFESTNITDIYIPASVCKIKQTALSNSRAVNFHVAKKNKHYAKAGQCIYSKKSGRLVAVTSNSKTLSVPNKVTWLKSADVAGRRLNKIVIPASVKKIDHIFSMSRQDLVTVYVFKGRRPPQLNFIFYNNTTLYVPKGTKKAYQKAVRKKTPDGDHGEVKIYEV